MKYIYLSKFPHDFSKVNLTTIISKRGDLYDIYKCSKCGIEGKRHGLNDTLEMLSSVSDKKINECTGLPKRVKDEFVGKLVKIIHCSAEGEPFENLKSGSLHRIVTPPDDFINGDRGVCVMGIG